MAVCIAYSHNTQKLQLRQFYRYLIWLKACNVKALTILSRFLSSFLSCDSNQNTDLLFSKAKVLPLTVGQRSHRKIINTAAGLTRCNLLLPLAIFRETWAALRSDVGVGPRVFALFGQRSTVAGQVDGKSNRLFMEVWHSVSVQNGCIQQWKFFNSEIFSEKKSNKTWTLHNEMLTFSTVDCCTVSHSNSAGSQQQ